MVLLLVNMTIDQGEEVQVVRELRNRMADTQDKNIVAAILDRQ